jgi:hypothetical protein
VFPCIFLAESPAEIEIFKDTAIISEKDKDTSAIKITKPSKQKEDAVFSDSKLKYKQNIKTRPGLLERFLEWLAEMLFGKAGYRNVDLTRKIIIWTIIIASFVIIIWLLSRSQLVSLIKPKHKATAFNFSDVTEDLNAINFEARISEAVKNDDFRLAIRWHYLKMLFVLDQKKLIAFAPYKTNIDYKYELKDKQALNFFLSLSRIYEYVWYGEFKVTSANYASNAQDFNDFEKQVNV